MRKEDKEVVSNIIITPKSIPKGGHTVVQFHLLLESRDDFRG
jgi:hypothetical protein